jgi:hypothetical protein
VSSCEPAPYTNNMPMRATYWPPGPNDGMGGRRVGAPVPLYCRWQFEAKLFKRADGREAVSRGIVYTAEAVALGGFLLLGTHTSDEPPAGAEEVLQVGRSSNLDGTRMLHKAWV